MLFPVGEVWEDDAVLHRLIGAARGVSINDAILVWHESRKDSITGNVTKDHADMKWIFLQRQKRYTYLKEHFPALAVRAQKDLLARAYRYGIYYSAVEPDRAKVREAVRWLREQGLGPVPGMKFQERFMLGLMRHCPPLFAAFSRVYLQMVQGGAWARVKKIIWRKR